MDPVPTSTLGLPSTLAFRTVRQRSRTSSSCLVIPTGVPRLKPPPDQGSRLQNISSLRMVLVSVSASARSLSRELAASPEDLRAAAVTIEASASLAVLAARTSSASDAISSARNSATGGFSTAATYEVSALVWCVHAGLPTYAIRQTPANNAGMSNDISVPIAIAAIVSTAVGTCLVSLLLYYLVIRHRKAKQRAHEEEKEVNAALDRAIVSYIVKELPSPQGSVAPAPPPGPVTDEPPRLELEMTAALGATMDDLMGDNGLGVSRRSHRESPILTPPPKERRQIPRKQSVGRVGTLATDMLMPLRRTVSSRPVDSAESVYASILARPLEHVRARSEPPMVTPVPAPRDDVGWPLTSKDGWL